MSEYIPKALLEVWEMKRLANEELEKIPDDQKMTYIHEKVKDVWEAIMKKRAENKLKQQNK